MKKKTGYKKAIKKKIKKKMPMSVFSSGLYNVLCSAAVPLHSASLSMGENDYCSKSRLSIKDRVERLEKEVGLYDEDLHEYRDDE